VKAVYSIALRGQAGIFEGKDVNKAEMLLRKAVEVDPQSSEAHFDLGKLYTQSKNHPKAIKSYQKAIGLNPRSAKTVFNLGFVYATTEDFANAEEMFHRAAELKPPFLDKAIFNLAMVQQKQGKEQECVNNLEKALMINPENHRARKYLEQLTGISGVSR
jgi:Tfp pilus assembly protein PilF